MQRQRFIARVSLVALTLTQLHATGVINVAQTLISTAKAAAVHASSFSGQTSPQPGALLVSGLREGDTVTISGISGSITWQQASGTGGAQGGLQNPASCRDGAGNGGNDLIAVGYFANDNGTPFGAIAPLKTFDGGITVPAGAGQIRGGFADQNPNDNSGECTFNITVKERVTECSDGKDNEGDGAADFPNDFSCDSPEDNDEFNPRPQCNDREDNDGDGKQDGNDPGCSNGQDNNESDEPKQEEAPQSAILAPASDGPPASAQAPAGASRTFANRGVEAIHFVNTHPDFAAFFHGDPNDGIIPGAGSVDDDPTTALKVCQLAGFNHVASIQNREFSSCGDNTISHWNGNTFVAVNACTAGNRFLDTLVCDQGGTSTATQCSDGRDNDGDGKVDAGDFGCIDGNDDNEFGEPFGFVDGQANPNLCRVYGWACDPDNFNQPIDVHFYLNGPAGGGGTIIGSARADRTRDPGITQACGGNGAHAFEFDLPTNLQNGQTQNVFVHGINIGSPAHNPVLTNSPARVVCNPQAQQANLTVEKVLAGGALTVTPNQPAIYEIRVTNASNVPAQNVIVIENIPQHMQFVTDVGGTGCALTGNNQVQCPGVTINPNQTKLYQLKFMPAASAPCGGTIRNQVDVQSGNAPFVWDDFNATVQCQSNRIPTGSIDVGNCQEIAGWTCDQDVPNNPLDVHFYVNASAYNGGTIIGNTLANLPREPQVGQTCGGNSAHGFSFPIPANLKDGQNHTIFVHPINQPSGDNPHLNPPITINCPAPGTTVTVEKVLAGGALTVTPNQPAIYEIRVRNTGTIAAQNVVVIENIPQHMNFVADVGGTNCSINASNQVQCPGVTLNPGETKLYQLKLMPTATAPCGQTIRNQVDVQSSNAPFVWDDFSATVQCAPSNQPPIGHLDGSNCEVLIGWACDADNFAGPIDVHLYNGPAGQGGQIVGSITANAPREAAVGQQCGGNVNHGFNFPVPASLKDGQPHQIFAYAINTPAGSNPPIGNVPLTITCAAAQTNLTVEKVLAGGATTVSPNQPAIYEIRVRNTGTIAAQNVVVIENIPQHMQFITDVGGTNCTVNNSNQVQCPAITLNPGETKLYQLKFMPVASAPCGQQVRNQVDVQSTNAPFVWDDFNATVSCQQATLIVEKTVQGGAASGAVGQPIFYNVRVQNTGTGPANNVVLLDNVPQHLSFVQGGSTAGCTEANGQVQCNLNTIAASATANVTLKFMVNQSATALCGQQLRNQVDITSTNAPFVWDDVNVTIQCNQPPIGHLDGSNCEVLIGWACDADNFAGPIDVHLYNGPA
ncbi:DUF11 domain-containing protein, partial [Candidatus Peregrinibacteria bacterium]|nr:DUF11 domain-containing protein [Candidatus Peregrinibacteria bacterium]